LKSGSDAIEYHARLALDWEERYSARRSFRARHAILAALLEEAVRPGERWLDAGCGTGHFSRQLARLGAHVTGVDGAESMITRARSLGADAPGSVVYRDASDVTRLPDPDGCFVMMMALPFGSTRAFATAKSLFPRGHLANVMDERPERVAG
jgi:ubiquinone/menaquinone biosynthesis C-methylase UbiE